MQYAEKSNMRSFDELFVQTFKLKLV